MTSLSSEKCVACRHNSRRVSKIEIEQLKSQIPEWNLLDDNDILKLNRTFKFQNYGAAAKFTWNVAMISEEEGHHPQIILEWGNVRIAWWTHLIKGLHRNDFLMAAKTDKILAQISENCGIIPM